MRGYARRTLKRFFEGQVSAKKLAEDIAGSSERVNNLVSYHYIEDMATEFRVNRPMLIGLCDAVLAGGLRPEALQEIGFALAASDKFEWDADDDEIVAEVINDWSCPEINYPLTIENVRRFKAWLENEQPYPLKQSGMDDNAGIISIREKKSAREK